MHNLIFKTHYTQIQLILGLISLFILNCSNVQGPDETFAISCPLSVGKTWEYETVNLKLPKKDTFGNPISDTTFDTSILKRTIIQKDTDIAGFPVYTFKDSLGLVGRYNYYQEKDNGIYSYLLTGNGNKVMIKSYILDNNEAMRPFLLIPSTFKYNQTWETQLYPNSTIDSIASIILKISFKGEEKVITKAGVFDCFVFEKSGKTGKTVLYIAPDIGIVKQIFISYEGVSYDTDNYSYQLSNEIVHIPELLMLRTQSISLISYN